MTISQLVTDHLERLVGSGPKAVDAVILETGADGGYLLGVADERSDVRVSLNLHDYDRYSATLRSLEVSRVETRLADIDAVRACAETIATQLVYLEEPLVLLELDETDLTAQIRSNPPQADDTQSTYWEVMIYAQPHARVTLRRYRWHADNPDRGHIASPVTFANLGRLSADLATCLKAVQG